MAAIDLETEVMLGRLCTRAVKSRIRVKLDGSETVLFQEGGYRVEGRWEGREYVIRVAKTSDSLKNKNNL